MKLSKLVLTAAALAAGALTVNPAVAQIKVGVLHSLTGSASAQGITQKQAIELAVPSTIGGEKVTLVIMDDATDPAIAARNAKKLIEQDGVDLIIGPTATPSSIATAQAATAAKVPHFPGAPVSLGDARDEWLFNVPPPPVKWILPAIRDMKKRGVKTVGFLGFSDAWGDVSLKALQAHAEAGGYKIVADERYARADTTVTGQVLRLMAAKPDAIFMGVAGSPGVLGNVAIKERGYTGPIYNGNGVFNNTFLTLGGPTINGVHAVIGAIGLPDSLPDSDPRKPVVQDFLKRYTALHGKDSADAIAGYGYDAAVLAVKALEKAVASKAKPGTPAFREALAAGMRDLKKVPGVHSIYTFDDPKFPWGVGDDATFLVKVANGKWAAAE